MSSRPLEANVPHPQSSREGGGGDQPPIRTALGSEEPGEFPSGLHPIFVNTAERILSAHLPKLSDPVMTLLKNAEQEAIAAGDKVLGLRHLFLGLLETDSIKELLQRQNISIDEARSTLIDDSTEKPKPPQNRVVIDAYVPEAMWLAANYANIEGALRTELHDVFNACRELRSHDPNLDQLLRKMGIPQAKR